MIRKMVGYNDSSHTIDTLLLGLVRDLPGKVNKIIESQGECIIISLRYLFHVDWFPHSGLIRRPRTRCPKPLTFGVYCTTTVETHYS
jgi:hypothetical protein